MISSDLSYASDVIVHNCRRQQDLLRKLMFTEAQSIVVVGHSLYIRKLFDQYVSGSSKEGENGDLMRDLGKFKLANCAVVKCEMDFTFGLDGCIVGACFVAFPFGCFNIHAFSSVSLFFLQMPN